MDTSTSLSAEPLGTDTAEARTAQTAPAKKKVRTDYHLWGTYFLLIVVAVIELFSASIQEVSDGNIFGPVLRHSYFIIFGLGLMYVLQWIPYRWIFRASPYFAGLCLLMMGYVLFFGTKINGAYRAIEVGPITLLPAEFMKLGAALGMAWILSTYRERDGMDVSWKGVWIALGFLGVCCLLLFSQGLSNTLVVLGISVAMMLVSGMSWRKLGIVGAIAAVVLAGGLLFKMKVREDVRLTPEQERVIALNKEGGEEGRADGRGNVWRERLKQHFRSDKHLDKFSTEHQQEQLSYIAQAHGGLFGVGIGRSRENARLPLAFSDYIYAIIIEELGLFVGLGILVVYMWILGRSAKLALLFRSTRPGIIVMGCAFVIVFQALYHMAIVTGVFPVSGQPLPLISKGGISVIVTSLAFGVMLSTARHATRKTDV